MPRERNSTSWKNTLKLTFTRKSNSFLELLKVLSTKMGRIHLNNKFTFVFPKRAKRKTYWVSQGQKTTTILRATRVCIYHKPSKCLPKQNQAMKNKYLLKPWPKKLHSPTFQKYMFHCFILVIWFTRNVCNTNFIKPRLDS